MEKENVLFESTGEKSAELYSLHLQPVVVLRNHLPIPVEFSLDQAEQATSTPTVLEPGHSASLFNAKPGKTNVKVKVRAHFCYVSSRQW